MEDKLAFYIVPRPPIVGAGLRGRRIPTSRSVYFVPVRSVYLVTSVIPCGVAHCSSDDFDEVMACKVQ